VSPIEQLKGKPVPPLETEKPEIIGSPEEES
jgi:hypothetical protein